MAVREPIGGQLELLSRDALDRIHGATVEVLDRVGVKVWGSKARSLFKEAGADVNERSMMVRIPESLLRSTVRKAPSEFMMYGRDPNHKLRFGGNYVHFGTSGLAVRVHDLDGKTRPGTLEDVGRLAKLADACENIHNVIMMVTPSDAPSEAYHLQVIWEDWKNSGKTTDGWNYSARQAMETIEMGSILRGSREELAKKPCLLGFTNPVSPLQLSKELTDGAIVYAQHGQPMIYAPEALAGGTAPATLAGLLVQQNAEILAGIMVSELASPGAPVMYGTVSAAMDMRTGSPALGGPEVGLINIAAGQLGRYYNLPRRGTGGNSDSKLVDAQSALETSTNMLMAALAGINFVYDACGSLEGSLTTSYEKLVIDDEIAGMVTRILDGIDVSDRTLAVDEICRIGPSASYLSSAMTAANFRKEFFIPSLLDRHARDAWSKGGSKDISEAAREKAIRLLREHEVEPIEKDVRRDMEAYLKRTLKGYKIATKTRQAR